MGCGFHQGYLGWIWKGIDGADSRLGKKPDKNRCFLAFDLSHFLEAES